MRVGHLAKYLNDVDLRIKQREAEKAATIQQLKEWHEARSHYDDSWSPPFEGENIGHCDSCYQYRSTLAWRRQNTQYASSRSNWCYECEECFERTQQYWQDMWDDYHLSRY